MAAGASWFWFNTPNPASLQNSNPRITSFMKRKCADCSLNWTPLAQMSPFVPQAVVVAEDIRFFFHHGLDWNSLRAAFWLNLKEGHIVWGGSTITQQLAKNLYLGPEKTFGRKLREVILTLKLERSLTKNRILEIYLNVAQWGPSLFGITAASQHYFGKSPKDLGPLEAAFLASILPNPARASEENFQERFTDAGSRIFDLLLQSYLPPVRRDKSTEACEDRLTPEESQETDYIVAKAFSAFANDILSGQAFLLTEERLWEALDPEEVSFVRGLLQNKREHHPFPTLSCERNVKQDAAGLIPLVQASNEYGNRTYWIPQPAYDPVQSLLAKAHADGIPLIVTSAYRGSGYQHYLLLAFLRQDTYCLSKTFQRIALPEESEHSCVDFPAIDFGILGGEDVPFEQTETYRWLQKNAPQAGFHLSYPRDNPAGMAFEPWHWRWEG
ncbi:MAG: transglycosylase domain-containing protein [Deltaproteobacteria bacterium]|nr:transglycosylase domain-containing protein [Deltaproteobacteria bacterium]